MRMGAMNQDSSMEDILASIKRIIAEDGDAASLRPAPRTSRERPVTDVTPPPVETPDSVLELTEPVSYAPAEPAPTIHVQPVVAPMVEPDDGLISDISVQASRHALDALSAMVVRTGQGNATNTLDGLVVEMLRPLLKQWLDQHLPDIVEAMVQREIVRITGKSL
jgi:cell pole-organizing protein PopZ